MALNPKTASQSVSSLQNVLDNPHFSGKEKVEPATVKREWIMIMQQINSKIPVSFQNRSLVWFAPKHTQSQTNEVLCSNATQVLKSKKSHKY